jgi:NADH-quinone oxidoreductase subunit N
MNVILLSAILGVVMMFAGIATKKSGNIRYTAIIGLIFLLLANCANSCGWFSLKIDTTNFLSFSNFSYLINSILIFSTLIYVLLSGKAIEQVGINVAEYFALIFFVLCGTFILSSYDNLLMLFLGVEIMTIPLFILTGADKRNLKSNEASLKYFLMGAFSTGIMLMGIALVYGISGSFSVDPQVSMVATTGQMPSAGILLPIGLLFLFMAMAFKVSAAPFHFWTPDVYDGAPAVFTSFMATIVKAAGFVAFIKLFAFRQEHLGPSFKIIVPLVIVATLFVGNITAVFQQSVKRMLAYSSIAQAGFMLFALYSTNDLAREGIVLYAIAYSLATIGIFAVLVKMKDYTFDGFNGLAKQQPLVALATTICLLSLAGIPLTAGFFAKYFMLAAAIKSGASFALVIVAVLFAAVSVYYYFRVIQAMYFKSGEAQIEQVDGALKIGLVTITALLLLLGVYPSLVTQWLYF